MIVEMNKYRNDIDKKIKLANEQTGLDDKIPEAFNRRSMSIEDLPSMRATLKTKKEKDKNEEQVDKLFEDLKLEKDKSIKNSYYYSLQKEQLVKNLKKRAFNINGINDYKDILELKKLKNTLVFEEVNAKKVPITVRLNEISQKVNKISINKKRVKP